MKEQKILQTEIVLQGEVLSLIYFALFLHDVEDYFRENGLEKV